MLLIVIGADGASNAPVAGVDDEAGEDDHADRTGGQWWI
mgnify:CR=1 FL=1